MAKFRKSKQTLEDKIRALDPAFVDDVVALSNDQIKEKLVSITRYDAEMEEAKKNDQHLQETKEQHDAAGEVYKNHNTASKLKKKLLIQILDTRAAT